MKIPNLILFDDSSWQNLLPLTFTRPVAEIRIGILTIREKWEKYLNASASFLTEDFLSKKFPVEIKPLNLLINGSILLNEKIAKDILKLSKGQRLISGNIVIAALVSADEISEKKFLSDKFKSVQTKNPFVKINHPSDIFTKNGEALEADFKLITYKRKSQTLSKSNKLISFSPSGRAGVGFFIEKGAKVECAILNSTSGSIYIGKDAEIMEGSVVRGGFALCEHSTLKLSAKIYGPTTIGPHCKVGGEVNNSVIFGFSNKAHDGFLGNSIVGEWCNLGADTNNSNLKNNYEEVKLWNYGKESFINTGLQFCGLIMGDHSKCGINTMFNTGTVVGVSANIFGAGFPRNFIPDFSWGGAMGFTTYQMNKAFETAQKVMSRREIKLTDADKEILSHIFQLTEKYRR